MLAAHFVAVHRESIGVALSKPRTTEEVKAERTLAKSVPALAAGVKEGHAVDDFRYALSIIEQHLTPSKDHPGEWVLTSGETVIRVRDDQVTALRVTVAKQLKDYMAQLVKAMVRVWETYDSIQRGNSSFKLGLLGGVGGATDPGDQSDFKNRIIAVRDGTVKPLVEQGQFVEAFKWIMVQKDMVDRQAKEVNDYDSDLDVGYSRLAIAASVVQVALMALVPVAGEAAIAGGAGILAVGGTAVAAGAGGAALAETGLEAASGDGLHGGKIASKAYAGGVIGLGAIAPAATKSVTNFIAPAGLLAPAEGTALVGAERCSASGAEWARSSRRPAAAAPSRASSAARSAAWPGSRHVEGARTARHQPGGQDAGCRRRRPRRGGGDRLRSDRRLRRRHNRLPGQRTVRARREGFGAGVRAGGGR